MEVTISGISERYDVDTASVVKRISCGSRSNYDKNEFHVAFLNTGGHLSMSEFVNMYE